MCGKFRQFQHPPAISTFGVTALLFIDLDQLKQANDRFGHSVSDLLLKFVAYRICACVREADTVARSDSRELGPGRCQHRRQQFTERRANHPIVDAQR